MQRMNYPAAPHELRLMQGRTSPAWDQPAQGCLHGSKGTFLHLLLSPGSLSMEKTENIKRTLWHILNI